MRTDAEPGATPAVNILLVDDHPANLLALEAILEPLGQRLVKATSGEEALKWLLKETFAVILMDVQMPDLDGFQTVHLIKQHERTRHIPVIFLTALSRDAAHVFQGYARGAVDYLMKPFEPEILRSKVSVFVELFCKTEQIKRQQALLAQREREALERRSEQRLRGLIESMPACVWAAGADGAVFYANRVWLEYSGTPRERQQEGFLVGVHPDERARAQLAWLRSLETGQSLELQLRLRSRMGEHRWHLCRAVPERDEAGAISGWIITATEIDEQKRTEEALARVKVSLELANEAKDAFLAAASHELRTPLQAAKGHAFLAMHKLGKEGAETAAGRSLATVMRQIDRMARLVEQLLDVSRIQAGRLSLQVEELDLVPLLEEAWERMRVLSPRHELQLQVPGSIKMTGDRGRLDQVITNLVSNAIRYSPDGGPVKISATVLGDSVHLSVADQGLGIPREKQRLIFERFGRAHGANYGGLGLGLSICQGIVEQHHGRIWVESDGQPRHGSTFHVLLPLRPAAREGAGLAGDELLAH